MSTFALGAAGFLYLLTAVDFLARGDRWLALAFFAYAIANVGFIGATLK